MALQLILAQVATFQESYMRRSPWTHLSTYWHESAKRARAVVVFGAPTLVVVGALAFWLLGRPTASTDNAYVKADVVQIASDIAGRVLSVEVRDHARVSPGDVLIRIDPEPFRLALQKAEAELDQAKTQVETYRLLLAEARMELKEAESKVRYGDQTLARQRQLASRGVAATAKLEEAESGAVAARDRVQVLREKERRALAALGNAPDLPTADHALVREKTALRDRAAYDLSRTTIVAPSGGIAANVKLQPGEQIKAATPVLAIVTDTRPWVEANFKETDLTHMQPGQLAEITIDTYPGLIWTAVVESISPATGAEFAILPPQNASGNWVKVVQRLPVKLRLQQRPGEPARRAGMTPVGRAGSPPSSAARTRLRARRHLGDSAPAYR
jgi:membrane fusion protein (multidrug efflux system)